jgi:hypothetical protein
VELEYDGTIIVVEVVAMTAVKNDEDDSNGGLDSEGCDADSNWNRE